MYETYTPKTFEDNKIHKFIIRKLKNINIKTFINTIFYGPDGTGKYCLAKQLLNHMYGSPVHALKKQLFIDDTKELTYFSSAYHYELYLTKLNKHRIFKQFINTLSYSMNINTSSYNILLIKNAHYLSKESINYIKHIIETRGDVIKFIFITNSINKIHQSIKTSSMCIRIPRIHKNTLHLFISDIIKKEKIDKKVVINDSHIYDIIEASENNISKCILNLHMYMVTSKTNNFTFTEKIIKPLFDLIKLKDIKHIEDIRKILYKISAMNIDKLLIITTIFKHTLTLCNTNLQKKKLIDLTSIINHKMCKSYKLIIHIEYYIIYIMTTII